MDGFQNIIKYQKQNQTYTFGGNGQILKCPYMDITVPEKRSASVQGVLPSAQRPTHRQEAEPPRLQNGDINISLQPQQLRHRGQQRHFPELTWRNIRGDSLNKS